MASVNVQRNDMIENEVVRKLCVTQNGFLGCLMLSFIGNSIPIRFEDASRRSDILRKRRIFREVVLNSFHNANVAIIVIDPNIERQHIIPTKLLFTGLLAHVTYCREMM